MNATQVSATGNRLARLRRRAHHYFETGQFLAAQTVLESLLQDSPHDVSACMELASVLIMRGQWRASTSNLLRATSVLGGDVESTIELARRLRLHGEILAARECLDRLENVNTQPTSVLAALANEYWKLGQIPTSLTWLNQAMEAGCDTPDDHYLHAMLYQSQGNMDQAEKVLESCLRKWPTFSGAAMALARLRKQTTQTNHLDFLQAQLRRIPAASQVREDRLVRAEFEYALFKELDDLGRDAEAWAALTRSNEAMHALTPYDAQGEVAMAEAVIEQADRRRRASSALSHDGPIPIFVVGMPRSGTTLLDRMLSNHSRVISAGELNDFLLQLHWTTDVPGHLAQNRLEAIRRSEGIDVEALGARYLKQTQWRAQGHEYYIDKLPTNIYLVDLIHQALPQAPILHMVRDPMDVCFSNFKAMFGRVSAYSYEMQSLAHYYRQYRRVADQWRSSLGDAMLDVPYASLVRDPEATLREVLIHCGLDLEPGCLRPETNMAPAATPSNVQVREPIHTRSVGQWRRYERQLEPLRRALSSLE